MQANLKTLDAAPEEEAPKPSWEVRKDERLRILGEQKAQHKHLMASSADYRKQYAVKLQRRETLLRNRQVADDAEKLDKAIESELRAEGYRRAYLLVRDTERKTVTQWTIGRTGHHPELLELSQAVNELRTCGPGFKEHQLEVQEWLLSTAGDVADTAPPGPEWNQRLNGLVQQELTIPEHVAWIEEFEYSTQ